MDNLYDGNLLIVVKDKKGKEKQLKKKDNSKLRSSDDPKFMGDMAEDPNDTPSITKKKKINLKALGVKAKEFLGKKTPNSKPKSEAEIKKITSSDAYKKADYKTKTKMLGGQVFTMQEMEKKIKKKED